MRTLPPWQSVRPAPKRLVELAFVAKRFVVVALPRATLPLAVKLVVLAPPFIESRPVVKVDEALEMKPLAKVWSAVQELAANVFGIVVEELMNALTAKSEELVLHRHCVDSQWLDEVVLHRHLVASHASALVVEKKNPLPNWLIQ